ncbi:hypothetical protein GCM10010208_36550 [Actinomadura livida]|nr:hypothetical protein GCM10010208_36550 [Actinomadura livida]
METGPGRFAPRPPTGRLRLPGHRRFTAVHEADDSSGVTFQEPDTKKLRAALRPHIERSVAA